MDAENPVNTSSPPKENTEMEVENAVNITTEATAEETVVEEPMEESVEETTQVPTANEEPTPMEEGSEKDQDHASATPELKQEMEKEPQPMEGVESDSKEPPPFLSAPASWQIPVAALHQHQHSPAPQKSEPITNKTNVRKERSEARIAENQYDIEAWTNLINDAQQTGDLEAIREVYERVLKVFPTSVSFFFSFSLCSLSLSSLPFFYVPY